MFDSAVDFLVLFFGGAAGSVRLLLHAAVAAVAVLVGAQLMLLCEYDDGTGGGFRSSFFDERISIELLNLGVDADNCLCCTIICLR